MSDDSIPKPWTAIMLLNEEYFLAKNEEVNLLALKKEPLPLCCVRSRKFTSALSTATKLKGKPWEEYYSGTVTTLNYSFNIDNPDHAEFTLQTQSKRDYARNLHAVFLDYVELELLLFANKTPYRIGFQIKKIPKESETLSEVRQLINRYEHDYDLYNHPSKQARKLYERIKANPSCLEICSIESTSPHDFLKPNDVTKQYLDGFSRDSQNFMANLENQTGGIVRCVYKRYDTRAKGYVLDGLVKKLAVVGVA